LHSRSSEPEFPVRVGDDLEILLYGTKELDAEASDPRFEPIDEVEEIESDLARFPLLSIEKSISS
jgi:hypothetical protein